MYAAWLEDTTDADIHAIKKAMERVTLRAPQFRILLLQIPQHWQRKIASHRSLFVPSSPQNLVVGARVVETND
jgi:hypothetical protein